MASAASRLQISQREGVAQLTFAHPASRNSLDLASMERFAAWVRELRAQAAAPEAGGLRAFEDGRRAGRPG